MGRPNTRRSGASHSALAGCDYKMYESTYDYLGRRVRQVVKVWDSGEWSDDPNDGAEDRRLVYYQHLPLVEFDGDDENAVLVKYVWGPDPSPNRQGGVTIGGPGALIALRDASVPENYVCFSDGAGQPGGSAGHSIYDPAQPGVSYDHLLSRT